MDDGAGNVEIVKVTAAAGTSLTVVRAQEGTTGFAFADLDLIELRATAEGLQNPVQYTGEDRAVDLGDAASLEIPNGAAPTVDAAGEIAVDTTITDHTGLITYHDGTEALYAVGLPTANLLSTDGYVVAYNATNNEFEMVAQSGGGGGGTFASLTDITFSTVTDTDDKGDFQDLTYMSTSNPATAFGGLEIVGTTSTTQYKYSWAGGWPVMIGATGKEVGFNSSGEPIITNGTQGLLFSASGYIQLTGPLRFGATDVIQGSGGQPVLKFGTGTNTLGYIRLDNGNEANIYADGTGTDVDISLNPKGAGNVSIFAAGLEFSDDGEGIRDANNNEQLVFNKTTSAVNHVGVTNAATAGNPKIAAEGGDTNINLELNGKGTGHIVATPGISFGLGADVLDTYEKGTFTPTITCVTPGDLSVTYTQQTGTYSRTGDTVTYRVDVRFEPTHTTASGELRITGAPFLVSNATPGVFDYLDVDMTWPTGVTDVTCRATSTYFIVRGSQTGDNTQSFQITDLASASGTMILVFAGSYIL